MEAFSRPMTVLPYGDNTVYDNGAFGISQRQYIGIRILEILMSKHPSVLDKSEMKTLIDEACIFADMFLEVFGE